MKKGNKISYKSAIFSSQKNQKKIINLKKIFFLFAKIKDQTSQTFEASTNILRVAKRFKSVYVVSEILFVISRGQFCLYKICHINLYYFT